MAKDYDDKDCCDLALEYNASQLCLDELSHSRTMQLERVKKLELKELKANETASPSIKSIQPIDELQLLKDKQGFIGTLFVNDDDSPQIYSSGPGRPSNHLNIDQVNKQKLEQYVSDNPSDQASKNILKHSKVSKLL